jgi:L-seryl-tRNA(Ser) seleniumtransferase
MLATDEDVLRRRATQLAQATGADVVDATGRVGGGALPLLELAGPVVALPGSPGGADALAAALRAGDPPLLARIARDRVLVDPRTLADEELDAAAAAIRAAVGRLRRPTAT